MFAKVGAFSNDQNFICGDPKGAIKWIQGEVEAFDEVLASRGDYCAPEADPSLKGILDEFRVVNAAIDEVVDKLLNEVAEKVLKEDN
jgi:dynactin complex subunit